MVPPVVCAAAVAAAKIVAAIASHALTGLMKLLLELIAAGGADDVPVSFRDTRVSYTLNASVKTISGCSSTGQWLIANVIRRRGYVTPSDWINASVSGAAAG